MHKVHGKISSGSVNKGKVWILKYGKISYGFNNMGIVQVHGKISSGSVNKGILQIQNNAQSAW